MRIFIALLFPDSVKEQIYEYLESVEEVAESGNFSHYENLHLTILYIGEVNDDLLKRIKAKLHEINYHRFEYRTETLGYFKKSQDKKIIYLGVERNYDLTNLYNLVCVKLKEIGLDFPTGKYTPHITLAREVRLIRDEDIDQAKTESLVVEAKHLSIMESTRIKGRLTYREIDEVPFK